MRFTDLMLDPMRMNAEELVEDLLAEDLPVEEEQDNEEN